MSIVFDVIIVLIMLCCIYRGYRKGIVDVGFRLIAFIASLLISVILYSPITTLIINNTEIDEKIEEIIIKNDILSNEGNNNENESRGIDTYIKNYSKDMAKEAQKTIVETAAKPIARNIVGIGVMIILFLGSRIILTILKTFTDIITNLPVIKQFNEVAGLIYGLLLGLIIIYVILAITFFILSMSGNTDMNAEIEASYITKFFYNNNLILKLMF